MDLAKSFAQHLYTWVTESPNDIFHLALSGGKTPSLLFTVLAEKYSRIMPWHKIHFWWGDERMVPPNDAESNFGVVNTLLFSKISVLSEQIHQIHGEANPIEERDRYGFEIESQVPAKHGLPEFDLILLGLGEDGHTASIFPNQMQLFESENITEIVSHPVSGQQRITLTGQLINNSRRVAFLVSGESKARVFDKIYHQKEGSRNYPAARIQTKGDLFWFIDESCLIGNSTPQKDQFI